MSTRLQQLLRVSVSFTAALAVNAAVRDEVESPSDRSRQAIGRTV